MNNYCENCGKELVNGECTNCRVIEQRKKLIQNNQVYKETKTQNNKLIIITTILIVLIVLVVIGALAIIGSECSSVIKGCE